MALYLDFFNTCPEIGGSCVNWVKFYGIRSSDTGKQPTIKWTFNTKGNF